MELKLFGASRDGRWWNERKNHFQHVDPRQCGERKKKASVTEAKTLIPGSWKEDNEGVKTSKQEEATGFTALSMWF